MKFKYVDKFENWTHRQYYTGRKKGAKVEVFHDKNRGIYYFFLERTKDDFVFNSLWQQHPNEYYQKLLNKLPDMRFNSDEEVLSFVEKWIDDNVPAITKSN